MDILKDPEGARAAILIVSTAAGVFAAWGAVQISKLRAENKVLNDFIEENRVKELQRQGERLKRNRRKSDAPSEDWQVLEDGEDKGARDAKA